MLSNWFEAGYRLCMPLIPALRRQRQMDLCQFKASLIYRVSSRTARAIQRSPVLKKKKYEKKRKEKKPLCHRNMLNPYLLYRSVTLVCLYSFLVIQNSSVLDYVLWFRGWASIHTVTQAGLRPGILLPQLPE